MFLKPMVKHSPSGGKCLLSKRLYWWALLFNLLWRCKLLGQLQTFFRPSQIISWPQMVTDLGKPREVLASGFLFPRGRNAVTLFTWQLMKEVMVQFPAWQPQTVTVLLGEPGEGGSAPEGEMVLEWRPSRGPGSGGKADGDHVPSHSAPLQSTVSLKQFKSYISFY